MTLSVEQEFRLAAFISDVRNMSYEEVQARLIKLYPEMIRMEVYYKAEIRKQWGMGGDNGSNQGYAVNATDPS